MYGVPLGWCRAGLVLVDVDESRRGHDDRVGDGSIARGWLGMSTDCCIMIMTIMTNDNNTIVCSLRSADDNIITSFHLNCFP